MKLIKNRILPDFESVESDDVYSNLLLGCAGGAFYKNKDRQKIIKKKQLNDPVDVERYEENGFYRYLAIDPITGIDIGMISPGTAGWLNDKYPKEQKFVGRIIEIRKKKNIELRIEYKPYF